MLKKDITYTDFHGVQRTESFYFNLMNSELFEMEMSKSGGFEENIRRVIATKDPEKLIKLFKKFILDSYGIKSLDGVRHMKSPEITADFTASNAYSTLFMELAFDAEAGAAFVNGLVTKEQLAEVKLMVEVATKKLAAQNQQTLPVPPTEPVGPASSLPEVDPRPVEEPAASHTVPYPSNPFTYPPQGDRFAQ
jgi:hypothetical protein